MSGFYRPCCHVTTYCSETGVYFTQLGSRCEKHARELAEQVKNPDTIIGAIFRRRGLVTGSVEETLGLWTLDNVA